MSAEWSVVVKSNRRQKDLLRRTQAAHTHRNRNAVECTAQCRVVWVTESAVERSIIDDRQCHESRRSPNMTPVSECLPIARRLGVVFGSLRKARSSRIEGYFTTYPYQMVE